MKTDLILDLRLILGTGLIILLGVFSLVLISRIRQRREQMNSVENAAPTYPYPHKAVSEFAAGGLPQARDERSALIDQTYAQWLESFLLPDAEAGRTFVRTGIYRHWLRYQLTANSFAQAAGMLVCTLRAGADPLTQTRFDALLAFCLSRPSANNPDLMSWQVLPDVVPGARLDADPCAEACLAFALLCAAAQWTRSSRFDYAQLAEQRLDAQLKWMNAENRGSLDTRIISSAFSRLFWRKSGNDGWLNAAAPKKPHRGARTNSAGTTAEEAGMPDAETQRVILALGLGMLPETSRPEVSAGFGPDLGACLEDLRERLDEVGADDGGEQALLSPLSRLACCAAAAASFGGAELSRAYWETLSQTQARSGDGLGATLRLLAMMALNGNIWFDQALGEVAAD